MTKDLSQPDEIIIRLCQVAMSERVPKLVGGERNSGNRSVLRADRPQTGILQRSTLTDEDCLALNRWSSFKISLHNSTGFDGQGSDALFISFSVTANDLT